MSTIASTSSLTSRRGKIGVAVPTFVPGAMSANFSSAAQSIACPERPSCAKISFGERVMNGCTMTEPSSAVLDSSFASTHGCVSSMYLLARLINCQMFDSTTENSMCSIDASTFVTVSFARSDSVASNGVTLPV